MGSLKEYLKDYAFRMKNWQFALMFMFAAALVAYGIFRLALMIPRSMIKYIMVLVFACIYGFSRLSLVNKIGFGFSPIAMFGALISLGLKWCLVIQVIATIIVIQMCVRPTPIDLILSKKLDDVSRHVIGHTVWMVLISIFFYLMGMPWIMSHLTLSYQIATVIWIINLFVFTKLLTVDPMMGTIIKSLPQVFFNGLLSYFFVPGYIPFLLKLAGA